MKVEYKYTWYPLILNLSTYWSWYVIIFSHPSKFLYDTQLAVHVALRLWSNQV